MEIEWIAPDPPTHPHTQTKGNIDNAVLHDAERVRHIIGRLFEDLRGEKPHEVQVILSNSDMSLHDMHTHLGTNNQRVILPMMAGELNMGMVSISVNSGGELMIDFPSSE